MEVIILDHNHNKEITEAIRLACHGKVLICDDSTIVKHTVSIYELRNIDFQPIDESFYKYNWHDQFREFKISKRDKFKTVRIRRKR